MNKRIPQDVEQLMWLIAESGDSVAAQEFERRFPDFRFELMRRMSTVKSLKASKPSESVPVPTFRPSLTTSSARPRAFMVGVFALGLGVLAFGSYAITQNYMPSPKKPTPAITLPAATNNTKHTFDPNYTGAPPGLTIDERNGTQPTRDPRGVNAPLGTVPPLTDQNRKDLEPYSKLQDISIEDAPLQTVIELIASTSGLRVTFMPNPSAGSLVDFDKKVSVDYRQMSGLDMLRQLGKDEGFTAIYQEKNEFLIIPSVTSRPILDQ